MMGFSQPMWIIVGLVCCIVLLLLFHKLEQKRRLRLEQFAAPHLLNKFTANVSSTKRGIKRYLVVFAMFCCFVSLARPYYNFQWVDVKRKGIDIMFAVDTSKSMLAEDIKPNRLERAKLAILDFIQRLEGDRVGLIPFAGSSFLLCPLTTDYGAFGQSLEVLDTDIIPAGGTNLTEVIKNAEQILTKGSNHKILILLSDGEDLEGDALKAATQAAEKGLTIFSIGVGTQKGELIPNTTSEKSRFVKDENGNFIISKLDQTKLTQIAEKTGGIYTSLGGNGQGLDDIYQQKLAMIPKEEMTEKKQKLPIERFEWPLALAILILITEYLLSARTRNSFQYFNKFRTKGRKTSGTALLSVLFVAGTSFLYPFCADASKGEDAYEKGDYISAFQYYNQALTKDENNPKLNYNQGTAAYKNNLFDQAVTSFNKALKSNDPELQRLVYYNLGNAHYQKGQLTLQGTPEKTVNEWQKSLKSYASALALDPNFEQAKINQKIVTKKLEQLKKQQKKKEQQQDNKEQKKQQDGEGNKNPQGENKDQKQPHNNKNQQQEEKDNTTDKQESPSSKEKKQQNSEQKTDKENSQQKNGQDDETKQNQTAKQSAEEEKQQYAQQPQRPHPGEMSKEDARLLLDSLKDDEGNLNFVPKFQDKPTNKDW